jgi:hypothetical protein
MKSFEEVFEFSRMAEGNGTEAHPLCTATPEELKVFIPPVMSLPNGSRVVEIGTYTGRSTSVYFQVQQELNLDIQRKRMLLRKTLSMGYQVHVDAYREEFAKERDLGHTNVYISKCLKQPKIEICRWL